MENKTGWKEGNYVEWKYINDDGETEGYVFASSGLAHHGKWFCSNIFSVQSLGPFDTADQAKMAFRMLGGNNE